MTLNKEIDTEAILYKRDMLEFRKGISETQAKIVKTQLKVKNLETEKEKNEKLLEETKNKADETHVYRVAKLKSTIHPLEDAAKTIDSQKEKMQQKIAQVWPYLILYRSKTNII